MEENRERIGERRLREDRRKKEAGKGRGRMAEAEKDEVDWKEK